MKSAFLLFLLAMIAAASVAEAGTLRGKVVDAEGKPLPFVRILVEVPNGTPSTVSVWSAGDGTFASPSLALSGDAIQATAFRIGWEESSRERTTAGDDVTLSIAMRRIENVAHQVPASAWIPGEPGERNYHTLVHECSNCHQMSA
ncbi:MAG: carboxypeptidase regulatory-like domain-containing protein, partial [Myxococcales bacterium]|nr:carboxypeptidase regulatory-like domain-containing protein [Myxococcales bacterium]